MGDTQLVLPINSSLSATVDQGSMMSKTSTTASKDFKEDTMSLNGKNVVIQDNPRVVAVLKRCRENAQDLYGADGKVLIEKDEWTKYKVKIISNNNFPTAAGLA